MPTTLTVKGVDITVERLLYRAFKRRGQTSEMLTRTLDMNPGISASAILPLGTTLVLPDPPTAPATPKRRAVSLFEE